MTYAVDKWPIRPFTRARDAYARPLEEEEERANRLLRTQVTNGTFSASRDRYADAYQLPGIESVPARLAAEAGRA